MQFFWGLVLCAKLEACGFGSAQRTVRLARAKQGERRRAGVEQKDVAGHGADDACQLSVDLAISGSGKIVPPQAIFEGTTERCHPPNTNLYWTSGWQITESLNHWSSSHHARM